MWLVGWLEGVTYVNATQVQYPLVIYMCVCGGMGRRQCAYVCVCVCGGGGGGGLCMHVCMRVRTPPPPPPHPPSLCLNDRERRQDHISVFVTTQQMVPNCNHQNTPANHNVKITVPREKPEERRLFFFFFFFLPD